MRNTDEGNMNDMPDFKGEKKPLDIINPAEKIEEIKPDTRNKAQINAHMARWFFDHQYQQMIWSDGIYEILELDPQRTEADYYNFLEIIHHEDRHIKIHANNELTKTSKPIEITYRILLNDGREKWINEICNTDFDLNKNPLRSFGTIQDITKYKLNEENFRYKEERINTLIESFPFAIAICQNNRFSLINQAGKELFRSEPNSELIGEQIVKIVHPLSKNHFLEKLESVRNGDQVPTFECILLRLDGSIFDAEVTLISTSSRGLNTIQFIANDITKIKATEKALIINRNNLIELANSTLSVLCTIDLTGKVINLSPVNTNFMGYTYEELLNKNISLFLGKASSRIALRGIRSKSIYFKDSTKPLHIKQIFEAVAKDGSKRWLEVNIKPQLNLKGELAGYSGICRDVTETINNQKQLRKMTGQLNQDLATRNKFFSIIAHDLRVPFNSILGMIDLLESQYDEIDDSEKKKFLKLIEEDTQNTLFLLENLLRWSSTQNGKISYQPEYLNLKQIAGNITETLRAAFQLKRLALKISISDDLEVFADRSMIISVLQNLLSNAIKYSFSEGQINLIAESDLNEIKITVSDNGIGMTEEIRNSLFSIDEYVTTPGTAKEKGSGLGLILCKEFIDIHGGKIWVESEPEKGSSFTFTIPRHT